MHLENGCHVCALFLMTICAHCCWSFKKLLCSRETINEDIKAQLAKSDTESGKAFCQVHHKDVSIANVATSIQEK